MEKPSDLEVVRDHEPPRKGWVEPIVALLMALTTVGTAWCSYQSAAWTRQSNRLMNEFNALERRAGLLSVQGTQQATIHTGMFLEVLAAKQAGNEQLANFYVERFLPMYARLTMHGWRKDLLKIQMPIRIHLCQGSTNRGARAKLRTRPRRLQAR